MASNYEAIRADNVRKYGEGTRHLAFLVRLYTDRTHFVFELLQNAEDAGASKIRFDLFDDRLEVRHDGRPFNERDVRGICGVDEGTKAEDLTQIGKFGIGFKSVYAYTTAPEIHSVAPEDQSDNEHFRIVHYVRPNQVESKHPGETWTTLFILPFDVSDRAPVICQREIAERLKNLNARTLLFLRNMEEIAYTLPGGVEGAYLREVAQRGIAKHVLVIGQNNGVEEDETWLVFERPVTVPSGDGEVLVEIAFRLENSPDDRTEQVVKIDDSPLIVYFPTEKLTRLGFLIQGPYRTTPARDNIPKDDDWNAELIRETAVLVVEALEHLKAMGLMTVSLLQALPIRSSDFPESSMFFVIAKGVREALRNQDLLPSDDGAFVSAKNALLARSGELRTLLTHGQLRDLLQPADPLRWLSGDITQDRTPELRSFLMNELRVAEIDPEAFARCLSADFLEGMDDVWFARFYEFLLKQEALWRKPRYIGDKQGILREKPIIRLENGSVVPPFDSSGNPNAYLPADNGKGFALVSQAIASHEPALEFLKRLDLSEPDATANVIETILPKYRSAQVEYIDEAEYRGDLEVILRALKTDSQQKKQRLIEEVQKTPFVQAINAETTRTTYRKPDEVYLQTDDLSVLFEGNANIWFLSDCTMGSADVWKELGAADLPRRIPHNRIPREAYEHSRWQPTVKNYDLEGLQFFLNRLNQYPVRSPLALQGGITLWRILQYCLQGNASFFDGEYRWFYYTWKSKRFASDFQVLLQDSAWLPTSLGERAIPAECSLDELHPDLEQDDRLITALKVKPSKFEVLHRGRTRLLAELRANGFNEDSLEILDLFQKHPREVESLKQQLKSQQSHQEPNRSPEFPTAQSKNPLRREVQIGEQYVESPGREFDIRDRSVRKSRPGIDSQVFLRSFYTNDDQQLVCQICKGEMPFKKRDGEYYFEAVEALNGDYFSKEHEAQYLALCPLCAAMYTEFVKRDPVAMEHVANVLLASQEPEVPLQLGDLNTSIRFVDIHFRDLKTILMLNGGRTADQVPTFEASGQGRC